MGFVIVATEIQRADRPSSVSEKLSGRNAPRPFIRSDKRNDFSLQSAASSRERGRSEEISNRNYYLLFALIEGGRGQPRSAHSNPGTNDPRICLRLDVKCIFIAFCIIAFTARIKIARILRKSYGRNFSNCFRRKKK